MKNYSIVFNTKTGSRRSIRVNNPDTNLATNVIEAAVGEILANDVFDPLKGGLDSLNRMELNVTERTLVL